MTEITRAYEFVIMATDGTTPDLTFTDNDFAGGAPPTYGAWRVNELQGDSEGEPFTVSILDTSEQVTANLSDGGGRADLIGRVWRLRINEDGGGLAIVAMGRIVGVQLSSSVGAYDFQCGDERHWSRNRIVYRSPDSIGVAPTTQFYPPGLRAPWRDASRLAPTIILEAEDVSDANKVHFVVQGSVPMSEDMMAWLEDDMKSTTDRGGITGNFDTLRINIGGTDREITNFGVSDNRNPIDAIVRRDDQGRIHDIWVRWLAHGVSFEQRFTGVFLHAPTAEPSETLPFHIGGVPLAGVDLIQELKDRYDEEGVRYDTNAFTAWDATTNPTGLIAHPDIPPGHLRLIEPQNLAEFETSIFKSRGLAPFPNSSGELTPRFVTLPDTVNPSALTQVTAPKIRGNHPTWQQVGQNIVTVLNATFETMRQMSLDATMEDRQWPADQLIIDAAKPAVFEHDRIDDLGRHEHTIAMVGLWRSHAHFWANQLKEEIFNRYGDGPIRGMFLGMSALDGVAAGDFVVIDLSSYPDLATQTRGGLRLVQAMEIRRAPSGGEFEYVDAGADTDALAAPVVAIIATVANPKHSVDVTISSLPASSTYLLQLKIGSDAYRTFALGTANEAVTIENMPANTLITPRVKAVLVAQVGSAWATVAGVTTDAMAVPTTLVATPSGLTIELTWANGEADERIMPTLGGADVLNTPLDAGTSRWVFTDLVASTLLTVGVKHVDDFGGESALVTTTATTGTAATLTAPVKLIVIQGAPAAGDIRQPLEILHGTGIEYSVLRSDPFSELEIQISTDSGHSTIEKSVRFTTRTVRIALPLDEVLRYARVRAVKEGWTSSAFTPTVSALPTPFSETPLDLPNITAYLIQVPFVETVGGTRGLHLDIVYSVSGDVDEIDISYQYDDGGGLSFATDQIVSVGGADGRHRIKEVGNFHFEEDWTNIKVTVTPVAQPNDVVGFTVSMEIEDIPESGAGTRFGLTAGGTAMSDFAVPGTNVTVTLDSDGRPQINAVTGAGAALGDLSDVTITAAATLEVLAFTGSVWEDVALTAAHIQSGVFDVARIPDINASKIDAGTFGAGDYVFPADLTVTDQLVVSGVGPHGIGGAAVDYIGLNVGGSFVSGGASTRAVGLHLSHDITVHSADAAGAFHLQAGAGSGATITTPGASTTFTTIATARFGEPDITVGAGDTVTNTATVHITGAADEGTNNYALWVDDGLIRFDGQVDFGTGSISAAGVITGMALSASQVTAGTFGAGNYVFPGTLDVTGNLTLQGASRVIDFNDADAVLQRATVTKLTLATASATFVDPILAPDGTVTLPSHTFASETDTGMLLVSANVLGFSVSDNLYLDITALSATQGIVEMHEAQFVWEVFTQANGDDEIDWDEGNCALLENSTADGGARTLTFVGQREGGHYRIQVETLSGAAAAWIFTGVKFRDNAAPSMTLFTSGVHHDIIDLWFSDGILFGSFSGNHF